MTKKVILTPEKKEFETINFETFRNMNETYWQHQLLQKDPSNINFLSYRKYKVTIELIDEPKEVLIERLLYLLMINNNHYHKSRVISELRKLDYNI